MKGKIGSMALPNNPSLFNKRTVVFMPEVALNQGFTLEKLSDWQKEILNKQIQECNLSRSAIQYIQN
jgi:hypothetical protein